MAGRVFQLTFQSRSFAPSQLKRRAHLWRDSAAFVELSQTIYGAGFEWGDAIINIHWNENLYGERPTLTHQPEMDAEDLIVVTTRLPLNDNQRNRRKIWRSHTPLEEAVFDTARTFLERSTRYEVNLAHALTEARANEGFTGSYAFRERTGVDIRIKRAMGYLMFAPRLVSNGPERFDSKLLMCFAMAGVENVTWARALRKHAELVQQIIKSEKYYAVTGCWEPIPMPARPGSFGFTDGIKLSLEVFCADEPDRIESWQRVPYGKVSGENAA